MGICHRYAQRFQRAVQGFILTYHYKSFPVIRLAFILFLSHYASQHLKPDGISPSVVYESIYNLISEDRYFWHQLVMMTSAYSVA